MDLDFTDASKLSPTARAALDALGRLTLTELGAIEMYHFRRVKRAVAVRTAAECAAKVAAERGPVVVPPEAGDVLADPPVWTPELEAEARRQAMSGPIDAVRAEMAAAAERSELGAGMVDGRLVPEEDADEPDELDATPLEVIAPVRHDDGHDAPGPHVRK